MEEAQKRLDELAQIINTNLDVINELCGKYDELIELLLIYKNNLEKEKEQ